MPADALAAYKEAVALEPTNLGYETALAAAYERTHAYRAARALYEEIAASAKTKGDRALARECRTRIVTLWGLERLLEQEVPGLKRQFAATPPDVDAGRMLAEAMLHLRKSSRLNTLVAAAIPCCTVEFISLTLFTGS